jgi:hypothetical protein
MPVEVGRTAPKIPFFLSSLMARLLWRGSYGAALMARLDFQCFGWPKARSLNVVSI